MTEQDRFFGHVIDSVDHKTAFFNHEETQRMDRVREKIQLIREHWLEKGGYEELLITVKRGCKLVTQPTEVRIKLYHVFEGFRDYADVDIIRSKSGSPEQYDALELYCSESGYDYLFALMSAALRLPEPSEELLITAATLVEFLTIDLYNLRLSQIGDERYSNFQGVTYRGLTVSHHALEEYSTILANPVLGQRGFAIPLGLISSSTEQNISSNFLKSGGKGGIKMQWVIHIHGLDPDLLRKYRERYPESVVTSICAMPVGRVSPYGEKEILLRGAFFHLLGKETFTFDGYEIVKLTLVMINANRDHTTEKASNEGEKLRQRRAFRNMVLASRFEVCGSLAAEFSLKDAEEYKILQQQKINDLREDDINVEQNAKLADARSSTAATWHGIALSKSCPRHYADLRRQWNEKIAQEDWKKVEELLAKDYKWNRADWYNIGPLDVEQTDQQPKYTLMHELAARGPVNQGNPAYTAWKSLIEGAHLPGVWKTLKSFDRSAQTPYEVACSKGYYEFAKAFQPEIISKIDQSVLAKLEDSLHKTMKAFASDLIEDHKLNLPQLSILTEMRATPLWVPIPHMYGGFLINYEDEQLNIIVFKTVAGQVCPTETKLRITADTEEAYQIQL